MRIMSIRFDRLAHNIGPCNGAKTVPKGLREANIERTLAQHFNGHIDDNQLVLSLRNNNVKAVCFDMDGTLANSEKINWQIVEEGCKNREILGDDVDKIRLTPGDKESYVGSTIVSFLTALFLKLGIEDAATKAAKIAATKPGILAGQLKAGNVQGFEKIIKLAKLLRSEGFKLALVTSSNIDSVNLILEHFGLGKCFAPIIAREQMGNRLKPDSYPYELAMKQLKVEPRHTLVFEDSNPGIESARDAGTVVVALRNIEEQRLSSLRDDRIIPMDLTQRVIPYSIPKTLL